MRDEMKRTMFELFGVGSEDDKVLAAGGKKPVAKPEPVKTAPVQARNSSLPPKPGNRDR